MLTWNTLLFAGQWLFIALAYFVLYLVLKTVRREIVHYARRGGEAPVAPGRLEVIQPGGDPKIRPGMVLPLRPRTTLGYAPSNDIILADPYVSSQHARLNWDGSEWWAEDLNSANGTWVNGQTCPPGRKLLVPNGATLGLGDAVFVMRSA
jgi:hypothetical protein